MLFIVLNVLHMDGKLTLVWVPGKSNCKSWCYANFNYFESCWYCLNSVFPHLFWKVYFLKNHSLNIYVISDNSWMSFNCQISAILSTWILYTCICSILLLFFMSVCLYHRVGYYMLYKSSHLSAIIEIAIYTHFVNMPCLLLAGSCV